jgi:centractin
MSGLYDDQNPIVIDNGSGAMKAGFAKTQQHFVFPTVVGTPKYKQSKVMLINQRSEEYVGTEALKYKGMLALRYPMKNGVITNIDDMTLIWEHVYSQINCSKTENPVLLTEAPLNPEKNRNQMIKVFFENFNVPAVYVADQAILALYGTGRKNGLVLDCGHGVTHCVPVFEGFSDPLAITRMDVGGENVTEQLRRILMKEGVNFHTTSEQQIVQEIKEKLCRVRRKRRKGDDFKEDEPEKYQLPDLSEITIGRKALNSAPEILFDPSSLGVEYGGVQNLIAESIERSDLDIRRQLYSEIRLSGGSTMFKGFGQRLVQELSSLTDIHVKIHAPADPTLSTLMGGMALTTTHIFKDMWVSKKDYSDCGIYFRTLA